MYTQSLTYVLDNTVTHATNCEGLLRVGSLPCAPTYNRSVVQHAVFDRFGLVQLHEYSSKPATCRTNSDVQADSNNI